MQVEEEDHVHSPAAAHHAECAPHLTLHHTTIPAPLHADNMCNGFGKACKVTSGHVGVERLRASRLSMSTYVGRGAAMSAVSCFVSMFPHLGNGLAMLVLPCWVSIGGA